MTIDTPQITQTSGQPSAVIHLTIPRSEIQTVMGPAIGELIAAVKAQAIEIVGPVYSHHFKMSPDVFDFEVGVPVAKPVQSVNRVKAGQLPAAKVARSIYRGPYEGLGDAWGELCGWVTVNGLKPAANLWERYVSGPEKDPNPANWCTELNQPLVD